MIIDYEGNNMGWFGTYGEYKNVTEYADAELKIAGENVKLLDRAVVNSHVYSLVEYVKDGNIERVIKIDHVKRDGCQWSHHPMDESWGPNGRDCPERILKQSTQMDKVSIKWREQCRQQRRDKAARLKLINELKAGMVIESKYFGKLIVVYQKTASKIVCQDNLGSKYAYRIHDFAVTELQNALNNKG